jgi:hypothetical protein
MSSAPGKINFKIYQGSTFNEVIRWESSIKTYVPITGISNSAPLVVTVPGHSIPADWRVKFTNIVGMTDLNSQDTYHQVTSTTTNAIVINSINSIGFKTYTSGGIVEYNTPIDMTGYTAKMQIRKKITDTAYILELTTDTPSIYIDNTNKTINLTILPEVTAAFDFSSAVYSLELISAGGEVYQLINGNISLIKEVTR